MVKKAAKKKPTRKKASKKKPTKAVAKTPTPDPKAVGQVYRWILAGASERDIHEAIAAQWPDAEARPLIAEAMRELMDAASPDPELVGAWCFEAARDLYRRALEQDDFGAAMRALTFLRDHA